MPRLTDHNYLATHHELHDVWNSDPTSLFLLNGLEQWALHEYYSFSEKLSDNGLLEHRREVATSDPSLPQRAGRALAQWRIKIAALIRYREHVPVPRSKAKGNPYQIRVFAEMQPTLDPARIAKVLLSYERRDF